MKQEIATLELGRAAYTDRRWADAYAQLSMADRMRTLGLDDLERLAVAAFLTGHEEEKCDAFARAYHEALRLNDHIRALRYAFWSGYGYAVGGELARAEGWFLRGKDLLDQHELDCAERGYMGVALAFRTLTSDQDIRAANDLFDQALRVGRRFGDMTLVTMAGQGRARTLVHLDRAAEGVALLDEALVAMTAGEVSPLVAGSVFCGSIEICKEIFDMRRAEEWTAALSRWCESQPDAVPNRGECRTYRAEIMRLHGAWPDAMEELERARAALGDTGAIGAAFYQEGELYRLRGDWAHAETGYRMASVAGYSPLPGLALLLLAQGDIAGARAALQRALGELPDPVFRAWLLPAYVEVLLAADDRAGAGDAAEELGVLASRNRSEYLTAIAAHAAAAVAVSAGDAKGALPSLREAWRNYRELDAPYESARVRELLGLAFRALGDEASAEMEFDAARMVFEQLSASPDADRVRQRSLAHAGGKEGLTARELEVLALVTKGKTNRAIASDLVISEKTVARHLSNIFDKLSVSSRSELTAYAYEHGLVKRAT